MVIDKISATSTRVNDKELDEFVKLFEFLLFETEFPCSDINGLSMNTE